MSRGRLRGKCNPEECTAIKDIGEMITSIKKDYDKLYKVAEKMAREYKKQECSCCVDADCKTCDKTKLLKQWEEIK